MKSFITLISTALCAGLAAGAQGVGFNITMPADMRVHVQTVNPSPENTVSELKPAGNPELYTGSATASPYGLYVIYCNNARAQYSLPVYVNPADTAVTFALSIVDNTPSTTLDDPSNRALHTYAADYTRKSIELNKRIADMPQQEMQDLLKSYYTDATAIIDSMRPDAATADYMKLWSYIAASDAAGMANYMMGRMQRDVTIDTDKILPPATDVIDSPMAMAFPSVMQSVVKSLPNAPLEERLEALHTMYKTPALRDNVTKGLVNTFIDGYNYDDGMDAGEKRLAAIIEKYSLPESLMDTFRSRKATIKGTPFPDVALVDREGNKVDFGKYRGKWVYVDLWASWCGPCCKEVPYLQALEKEMAGSDVEFVSISIDSTRAPWLKKMEQLDMHGNQLWNEDENLPKQLNVKGIPHFLIYDPQGRLHTYKAPRPSSSELKALLQSL